MNDEIQAAGARPAPANPFEADGVTWNKAQYEYLASYWNAQCVEAWAYRDLNAELLAEAQATITALTQENKLLKEKK